MIKIGNSKYDTYLLKNCNLRKLMPYIYITPIVFDRCPVCGKKLIGDYVYAIQISKTECVKVHGHTCYSCSSFFSRYKELLTKLETIRVNKNAYELRDDYFSQFDKTTELSKFKKVKSAFKQYTVACKGVVKAYTIVYENDDANKEKDIIYYTDEIALALMRGEKSGEGFVDIKGIRYVIVNVKSKDIHKVEIKEDIDNVVSSKKHFDGELPEFTTQRTVYVYNGNLSCHKKHNVVDFKANIKLLDSNMYFYVEYCYDCDKFYIKYSDYERYLKKYRLFPAKLKYVGGEYDEYNRAEKSPLFLNGYNVNSSIDLSDEERQYILSFVIRCGVLSKRKVLDYLEEFIRTNGKKENMKRAVSKWEKDKEFVKNYMLDECPLVYIIKIESIK